VRGLKARVGRVGSPVWPAARKTLGQFLQSRLPVDIVKAFQESSEGEDKRKIRRASRAHPRHERPAFPPEADRRASRLHPRQCPDCGGKLQDAALAPKVNPTSGDPRQTPLHIAEHRGQAYWCPKCQQVYSRPLPAEVVKAGLAGPRLNSPGWLPQGSCHCFVLVDSQVSPRWSPVSRSSRGHLAKLVQKVSASPSNNRTDELLAALAERSTLACRRGTATPTGGTGCGPGASALLCTRCTASVRPVARNVLVEVLGKEFHGLLGCDYFSAYRKYHEGFWAWPVPVFCLGPSDPRREVLGRARPTRPTVVMAGCSWSTCRKAVWHHPSSESYASEPVFARSGDHPNALVTDAILATPKTREAGNPWPTASSRNMDSYFPLHHTTRC